MSLLNGPYKLGHSNTGKGGCWDTISYNRFGRVRLNSFWDYYSGPSIHFPSSAPSSELIPEWANEIDNIRPSEVNHANIFAEAMGWPFLGMLAHYERGVHIMDASGKSYPPIINRNGIVISTAHGFAHILPLQPIWPGFAINTILYALAVWLLWTIPFTLRRVLRRKPGHCIKCGYDLRGDFTAGCPECGWGREAEA